MTGKYEPAFILAGVAIAFSGLILYFIPPLQRHLAAKEARQTHLTMVPLWELLDRIIWDLSYDDFNWQISLRNFKFYFKT